MRIYIIYITYVYYKYIYIYIYIYYTYTHIGHTYKCTHAHITRTTLNKCINKIPKADRLELTVMLLHKVAKSLAKL